MTTRDPSTPSRGRMWLVAFALLVVAGLALAASYDGVKTARTARGGARTWYRTASAGTDSRTSATAVDRQFIGSDETYLKVFVRGSSEASTHQIAVFIAGDDGVLDVAAVQTCTLGQMNPGSNGYQPNGGCLTFDIAGAVSYDVRHVNASAGTLDISAHTCGAVSVAAE